MHGTRVLIGAFLFWLGLSLCAQARFDGIYKPADGSMNAWVQTYADRSALIVLTPDLKEWYVFRDMDYVDGFSAPDVTGKGFHLDWNFVNEHESQAALKYPDGARVYWDMQRWFSAPANNPGPLPIGDGWYRPVEEEMNFAYQSYAPGFNIVLVTRDFSHIRIYLDPSHLNRVEVDELTGDGTHLTLSHLSENQALARWIREDGVQEIFVIHRVRAAPGLLDQLSILGCDYLPNKRDAGCSGFAERFSCADGCVYFDQKLFGYDVRFCLGKADCVKSISNCRTENGWLHFDVEVYFPYQCVPDLMVGCCRLTSHPLLLEGAAYEMLPGGVTRFSVSVPE